MGATYLIVALLRIDTKSYPQCSNEVRGTYTNDSIVVNNTVLGGSDYPGLPPGSESWPTRTWISVEGTGNIVRNNITTRNLSGGDHNHELLPADVDLYFNDWIGLDFTLAPGSPAIDAGNPDGATTHDILGAPRGTLPDVGAYEY